MTDEATRVDLYTTSGCHLCEDAETLLTRLQGEGLHILVTPVEIAYSPELVDQYGIRIPVVRVAERELGWPFTLDTLRHFLAL
ncbi:MAG: glutaredoxin [Candidatus Azotimanducaceae bacterium]|jgi:glutaredoxin